MRPCGYPEDVMAAINQVLIHCGICRMRFPSPLLIPDTDTFERIAAGVHLIQCSLCNRYVSASRKNMTFVLEADAQD